MIVLCGFMSFVSVCFDLWCAVVVVMAYSIQIVNCEYSNFDSRVNANNTISNLQLLEIYNRLFTLQDGSKLGYPDTRALDTLRASVRRLLVFPVEGMNEVSVGGLIEQCRSLPDTSLLQVLFLAVVGQFTLYQSPAALPQKCALVVDASSGELTLKDSHGTQSVILEVLIIVSILCLMKAWVDQR